MKKKGISLAVGVVVLGCLFGTYFALRLHNEKAEEEALTESAAEPILNIDTDKVSSLSFQVGDTPVTFLQAEDGWTMAGDKTFPVNSSSILSVLSCLAPLEPVRTLSDVEDLSEYGLEDPQNTLTFTDTDGKETVVAIGDTNSSTGNDYLMVDNDSSTLYTVSTSLRQSLSSDLYSYALSEELPSIPASSIVGVTISRPGGSYAIGLSQDNTWQVEELADGASDFSLDPAAASDADQDAVNSAFSSLASSIYYSDYLEHNCVDPSAYGIGENSAVFTIWYEEEEGSETETEGTAADAEAAQETETGNMEEESESESEQAAAAKIQKALTFRIGSADVYGNYYVQLEGSTQIHTIYASTLSPFLDVTAADWEAQEEATESETKIASETEIDSEVGTDFETKSDSEIGTDSETESDPETGIANS